MMRVEETESRKKRPSPSNIMEALLTSQHCCSDRMDPRLPRDRQDARCLVLNLIGSESFERQKLLCHAKHLSTDSSTPPFLPAVANRYALQSGLELVSEEPEKLHK